MRKYIEKRDIPNCAISASTPDVSAQDLIEAATISSQPIVIPIHATKIELGPCQMLAVDMTQKSMLVSAQCGQLEIASIALTSAPPAEFVLYGSPRALQGASAATATNVLISQILSVVLQAL